MIISNYDKEKSDALNAVEIARQALSVVAHEIEKMQKQVVEVNGRIMPVENANTFGKKYSSVEYYKPNYGSWETAVSAALKHAEELKSQSEQIHAKNVDALENNRALADKIANFMDAIGMPESFSTYEYVGRKRERSRVNHTAGWKSDVQREIKTSDGYEQALKDYTSFLALIAAYEKGKQQEEEKLRAEKEKEVEAEKSDRKLAALALKYELPYESEWCDVLNALLAKNKYLALGHALLSNRNDLSYGYDFAESGLAKFDVVTDRDREIAKDIQGCINNWDGDGRIFRDTDWSYDALFALVNKDLLSDYNICIEHGE